MLKLIQPFVSQNKMTSEHTKPKTARPINRARVTNPELQSSAERFYLTPIRLTSQSIPRLQR